MAERVKALPRELSGGQQQRVAIARAMALNPKILLCDEATSALDPNITQSILELLKEINRKSGITIVVVTHQMEVVKNICNKMTILSHGKLTISGEVKDIFLNHPETLQEVLGKSTEFPRKEGKIYLEIQQGIEGEKSTEYILSELAVQAGVNFNVVWGGMDRYRSSVAGNIVLEFPAEEKDKAQQYLDKRQIYWRAR